MDSRTQDDFRARTVGRRAEDYAVRSQNRRHRMLFHVGQIITAEMNLEALFDVIMEETNKIMATERSTVFLHDRKASELWSLVAHGHAEERDQDIRSGGGGRLVLSKQVSADYQRYLS